MQQHRLEVDQLHQKVGRVHPQRLKKQGGLPPDAGLPEQEQRHEGQNAPVGQPSGEEEQSRAITQEQLPGEEEQSRAIIQEQPPGEEEQSRVIAQEQPPVEEEQSR